MCFWTKKRKNTTVTTNIKSNINTLAGDGNWTLKLSHPKRIRYLCTTELTESIDCSQLFNCFDAMGRNVNKQSRICGPHIFTFSAIIVHAWKTIFGSFSFLREYVSLLKFCKMKDLNNSDLNNTVIVSLRQQL